MKVVFLQEDSFIKLAAESLSAVLKEHGHECDLFVESGEKDFSAAILKSGADLFAFSCTTGGEDWVLKTASEIKQNSTVPIIVGGPHPTFFPKIIQNPQIDFICQGEGEQALIELLAAMEQSPEEMKPVNNIWSKDSAGRIEKTLVRPFIQDLDELPYPDFSIYAKYKYMVPFYQDMYPVMTGRGCPKNCNYCFNHTYKDLYRGKGKYLRKRSVSNLIQELSHAKDVNGIKKINFVDDSFFLYPEWIRDFCEPYKKLINLPFVVNAEATQVKDEQVRMIKEMGCICVRLGVETGNDDLRQKVLGKKVTTQQIKEAAGYIKRYGIKLSTYNILGLPGETIENAIETYQLNKEIGSDFTQCSLLQPYPGTKIYDYVKEKGLFQDDHTEGALDKSFFVSSTIRLEKEKEILNLQKLMQFLIQFHIPTFMVRWIIKLPRNPIFHLIFKMNFIYNKIRSQKIKLIPLIKLGLHSRSYMKGKQAGVS